MDAEYEFVTLAVDDGVGLVTFDRPPVNATNGRAMHELTSVFRSMDERRDINAVVLTSAGTRAFIAGADIKERVSGGRDAGTSTRYQIDSGLVARDLFWSIYECVVPVIGAINGPAIGAGLAVAACCNILLASPNARFGVTEINVGLLGAGSHLQRMVGPYMARYMYYSGDLVAANELVPFGCIYKIVEQKDLVSEAVAVAKKFAAKSPIGLRLAKESLNRVEFMPLKDAYRLEQDYTNRLSKFEDSMEASRAFVEGRPANWSGR